MDYYVILYVDCEGGKHIEDIVGSEEVARQFCEDMNEFGDGYSHYTYMGREQLIEEMK